MGMTFSTIHVQNHKKLEPKEFIKELSAYMKTKGLLPVTEEKAQYSYSFSFTENNSWLTLTEPTYEPGEETAIKTAQELAKALETNCILTGVIDSDMVILDLFDESGSKIDMAVLGSPDYGFEETIMGSRELWEPLLTPEHTWEQLLEAWNADKTFAEDILYRTETLLGIDYDSEEKAEEITVHFAKAGDTKKPKTLKAAFIQIFGEALEPLGFKLIKSKYPYFVRLIGGEIIHVISFAPRPMSKLGYKDFIVIGGVATVYRQQISLDKSPQDNFGWFRDNSELYTRANPFDFDPDFRKSLYSFSYKKETIVEAVEHSFKMTEKIMLPILNEVIDLNECINYFHKFKLDVSFYDDENFGNKYDINFYNESLLYIKINNHEDFVKEMKRNYDITTGGVTNEKMYNSFNENRLLQVTRRDKIYNNAELYTKALAELKTRKKINIEILQTYGLEI